MSNILFLEGVYPKDVEIKPEAIAMFEEDEKLEYGITPIRKLEDIPEFYTGLKNWPQSTNLKCWHCDCIFEDRPISLPTSMDKLRTNSDGTVVYRMLMKGVFDNFNCASAWNNRYSPKHLIQQYHSLLVRLYEDFNPGKTVDYIPPAEDRHVMKQWSGPKGIESDVFYHRCQKSMIPYTRERNATDVKFIFGKK
jgi:hypothetical protein